MDKFKGVMACPLVIGILVACIAMLIRIGWILSENRFRDAAVERGYAEWVLIDDTRGDTEWRWVEPQMVAGDE